MFSDSLNILYSALNILMWHDGGHMIYTNVILISYHHRLQ